MDTTAFIKNSTKSRKDKHKHILHKVKLHTDHIQIWGEYIERWKTLSINFKCKTIINKRKYDVKMS